MSIVPTLFLDNYCHYKILCCNYNDIMSSHDICHIIKSVSIEITDVLYAHLCNKNSLLVSRCLEYSRNSIENVHKKQKYLVVQPCHRNHIQGSNNTVTCQGNTTVL